VSVALLDWRRRVGALYAAVRATADPAEAHELWRTERTRLLATHPESAARHLALQPAAYDRRLRFEAAVDVEVPPARMEVATGTDGIVPFERMGRVHLPGVGSLDVWWLASYGGGVWLPVRDPSSHTYGGGRYVLDTVKGADLGGELDARTGQGTLVVDLNFAYNPSCAYDVRWACPLPPAGNLVAVPLDAGELLPTG
jgi:uncharacterized protein (DUF1684 family)